MESKERILKVLDELRMLMPEAGSNIDELQSMAEEGSDAELPPMDEEIPPMPEDEEEMPA
jgi:hypothetical protein